MLALKNSNALQKGWNMMCPWLKSWFLALLPAILLLGTPVAAEADDETNEAERLALEGVAKLLQALDSLMGSIPQYAAPEVLPNGDIIIRRLDKQRSPVEPHGGQEEESPSGVDT